MEAKEFYELNKSKYFYYEGERVRVVGYGTYSDQRIIISTDSGWEYDGCYDHIGKICTELIENGKLCSFVDIDDLTPTDQPELDLCKLLKGCEGTVLYSTMVGYCRLIEVTEFITIRYEDDDDCLVLESDGKYATYGECTLFPSKENRDWSTFVKPIKIKEGDPVMTKWNNASFWKLENYTKDNKSDFIVPVSDFDFTDFDSNKSKSIV